MCLVTPKQKVPLTDQKFPAWGRSYRGDWTGHRGRLGGQEVQDWPVVCGGTLGDNLTSSCERKPAQGSQWVRQGDLGIVLP